MTPPDIAMLAQQGYMQQQQQLAAMQGGGTPSSALQMQNQMAQLNQMRQMAQMQAGRIGVPSIPGPPQMGMQSQSHSAKKKKHSSSRPSPQNQMLSRQPNQPPPHSSEQYIKHALAPPGMLPPGSEAVEPWADGLDELDPRELAMGRYRVRHEILGEVFGPEGIKDIPLPPSDPWEGLGLSEETLEAKVLALESSVSDLEAKMDDEIETFRKRLEAVGSGTITA
ncbi:hypothetical protein P7C73_g6530, partial [Tremellales sp. Uapishka_1]